MSEFTIVLKVEVDGSAPDAELQLGTASAQVVRAGGSQMTGDGEPTVILVRIER